MNNAATSFLMSLALGLGSSAIAAHLPSITVKIDGNAARHVQPKLVSADSTTIIDLIDNDGVYRAEDVGAGAYTLTLVDEDKGDILLVEQLSVATAGGQDLQDAYRHITCATTDGKIVCLNNI